MPAGAVIPPGRTAPFSPEQRQGGRLRGPFPWPLPWPLSWPLLLALPALTASALLPWQTGWICAVAATIVLGVPHGALDVEIGRSLLHRRLKHWWFPVFTAPYLAMVAAVLLAWRWAPEATLAAFLTASVWHFGTEDTQAGGWRALFHGGLPIAVPVLLHPMETARVFSAVSGMAFAQPPAWLALAALLWLIPAVLAVLGSRPRDLLRPAGLCAAFAIMPPLAAFTLYFIAVHAPAHTAALIRHPGRAPRVNSEAAAWRLAAPTTVLTIAIGGALWPFYPGETPVRLLCLTLQLLAAFTLPHMMLDAWLERRDRQHSRQAQAGSSRPMR
jgi:Brp/Blh family beta-carotene 15,15'-monooxygenase